MYSLKGFTLFECIIVICIIGILSFYALPSFQNYQASQESKTTLQTIQNYLDSAKSYARLYTTDIVVCPSTDLKTCDTKNNWNKGLILFADLDKNKKLDSSEHIIYKVNFNLKKGNIHWYHNNVSQYITFQANSGLAAGSMGHITYCSEHNSHHHKKLFISLMGNMRIQKSDECN